MTKDFSPDLNQIKFLAKQFLVKLNRTKGFSPDLNRIRRFLVKLCSFLVYWKSFDTVGWAYFIPNGKALCHPSTKLLVFDFHLSHCWTDSKYLLWNLDLFVEIHLYIPQLTFSRNNQDTNGAAHSQLWCRELLVPTSSQIQEWAPAQ